MIKSLWIKLFSIVLVVVVPLMTAQYFLQKESIDLAFRMTEKNNHAEILNSHLSLLKTLSKLQPEKSEEFKKEFESTLDSRSLTQDLALVRVNLVEDILYQTLRNTFFVLFLSLFGTYWIARAIVSQLQRLMVENQTQSLRLERLGALESWQRVAKMMVHELRTPMTPMKLVATDIESKYQSLAPTGFGQYLATGAEIIRSQIHVVERLADGLTQFAKLPEVQKQKSSLSRFFRQFQESYDSEQQIVLSEQITQDEIHFDPALLNLLFFNLLKNAREANAPEKSRVEIQVSQTSAVTKVIFANSGKRIPNEMASEIFKPHVSGKSKNHFGVGLTIAKKIALDHQGDLNLVRNDRDIAFQLEIPNR